MRTKRNRRSKWIALTLLLLASAGAVWGLSLKEDRSRTTEHAVYHEDDVSMVSAVKRGKIATFDGANWNAQFWAGVNLGATTPGHQPGELSPTEEDYLRWFAQMKEMNVDVLRVYTILPPYFYQALEEFNEDRSDPLLLLQGIWSPEEELIGDDGKGRDAYQPGITQAFQKEIADAVRVIHGDADLPERLGHAGGEYDADVSRYLLGWIVGTEWYPYAVQVTDEAHQGMAPYVGTYFRAAEKATPFESWLARMLDGLAVEEMKYGWQHPVAFANWVTTDPLRHPNEPLEQEDLTAVDPMHVTSTSAWKAGYFSSYHVYPYYPDFLRYQPELQTYKDSKGRINPYAGYLHDLRAHHAGIPLLITEYGVPSSRGMAHRGPLERNQGMHTEEDQGRIDAELFSSIYDEGLDGAVLFSWHDEWFKFTWNTIDLELPRERRAMWRNRLTNEENFGVIAVEAGASAEEMIHLDGRTDDWANREQAVRKDYGGLTLTISHDEAYLYLLAEKKQGRWDFPHDSLTIGFDTLPGGTRHTKEKPQVSFSQPIEFLLNITDQNDAEILVNSAYDQHTWLYGEKLKMLPHDPRYRDGGVFLPWKLALSRELYLPATKQTVPFEELTVGKLTFGISDPNRAEYNSLSDWYAEGNVLEMRLPWMLIGFTDPSSLQVWEYPYRAGKLTNVTTKGINIQPVWNEGRGVNAIAGQPIFYSWQQWDQPTYHERKKKSFDILRHAFGSVKLPKDATKPGAP